MNGIMGAGDRWFVLLGENPLLWGQVCHLRELGYRVAVVAWNDCPRIEGDRYFQIDIKDSAAIIAALKQAGLEGHVHGALSSIDLAAPSVNAINAWCGCCTMPERFNRVLSKRDMRDLWTKAGLFGRFSETDDCFTPESIHELNREKKLICKPDVSASSRGITILEPGRSLDVICEAIEKARSESFNGHCLIEEFVEGQEFTVDLLGDSYGNVNCYGSSIQYHSKYARNNRVTVIHHWNSSVYDASTWNRIAQFGIECYKALGLASMFGHLEVIMKPDGTIVPVEMGARSSGFICSHTVWEASGHDYLADYISVLHGGRVEPGNYLNGPVSSMWFGYDIPAGSRSKNGDISIVRYLDPRIKVLFERHDGLKQGMDFGMYINDGDRDKFGYAILSGDRNVLTYESIQAANERFLNDFLMD